MRIIAGSAKGSQIFAPKGHDTRPTQDRVRESLFNILQGEVQGATVLDLFAGSGALALEAISRGASQAVAVEHDRGAMVCILRNIAKLGFVEQVQALGCDWLQATKKLQAMGMRFDLVFLDPPYAMVEVGEVCAQMERMSLLQAGALLVVEHIRGSPPSPPQAFHLRTRRVYGDTEITLLDYRAQRQ